jgi:photosystem II stability/assembly factor-like uncharacterized protein
MKKRILVSSGVVLTLTAALAILVTQPISTPPATTPEDVEPDWSALTAEERARIEKARSNKLPDFWFMRQRLSGDAIPAGVLGRELQRFRRDNKVESTKRADKGVDAAPGTWTQVGPENVGGRITALALDPNDDQRVWAGAAAGGVWRTTDGGTSWTPVFDDQTYRSVGALAAHPTDSNTVYVGLGEDNGGGYSYDGDGIYKTTDGGQTWTNMGLVDTRRIGDIEIDPVDPNRVFVAAGGSVFFPDNNRGIYRSTDGGQSWSKVLFVDNETGGIEIEIDPSNPNRIYAAMWRRQGSATNIVFGGLSGGVWISLDGGDTWTKQTVNGLPTTSIGRIGLAIAPSSPNIVYARYQNDTGSYKGLWKSNNSGITWFQADTGGGIWRFFMVSWGYYFGKVRVDPQDPDHVFLLDTDWMESFDGGVTFNRRGGMHVDHHDMIVEPSLWYMGNDGGFYWSTDVGASWTHSETMPISQAYDIAIAELDTNRRFMGLQDNGTVRTTTGGTSDWQNVLGGDGLQCEVDPTNSLLVYASSQGGNINRSTDGGDTFTNGTNGIGSERTNWNAPVEHDPVTSQKLYTGTYRVYRTVDGAQNWTPISPDLTDGPTLDEGQPVVNRDGLDRFQSHLADIVDGTVTTIDVSPLNTDIIWAGTDDGNVWVTSDGGTIWNPVDVPGRNEWVTRVTADPFQVNSAYVTFTGFRTGDRMPHIFRTTDLGANWSDVSGNLPNVPINDVVPDPLWEGRLFIGSDLGAYLTDSWGAQWDDMNGGFPISVIHDLVLHDPTRTLYAGTHSDSLWTFDLSQLPIPDRDLDGSNNLDDCAPDDGGAFAVPGEVTGVQWDDATTLRWSSAQPGAGSATVHDVARGALAELPVGGGPSESCLVTGLGADTTTDASVPALHAGFWYLVRGANVCGTGTYGSESGGAERVTGACP